MSKLCSGQLIYEMFLMLFRIKTVRDRRMRAIMRMHGEGESTDRAIPNDVGRRDDQVP